MKGILWWNCRGARKKDTGSYLRDIVGRHGVGLIGLLETKVEVLNRGDIDRLAGSQWEFFHKPAVGKSGGILVLWHQERVSFSVEHCNEQWVYGEATLPGVPPCKVAFVYGKKKAYERRDLWEAIVGWRSVEHPVIIGGDFNCCVSQWEKRGGKEFVFSDGARDMVEAFGEADMMEVGFVGPVHTWCNNKPEKDRIWVRLDRALLNSEGRRTFPGCKLRHLARINSDHCPILLHLSDPEPRASSTWLKFEDTWLHFPMARRLVERSWAGSDVGSPAEILSRRCSRTLRALHFWGRNKLRRLGESKEMLLKEVAELQEREGVGAGLNASETTSLIAKVKELSANLARLNTWWRQRAKARWIADGDESTRYFHTLASDRRRNNTILQVEVQESAVSEDPAVIESEFLKFFDQKWRCAEPCVEDWPSFGHLRATVMANQGLLLRDVSNDEIWASVKALKPNRAPGLDGMSASFFQHYWSIVGIDVCRAVKEFFSTGRLPEDWKETAVVLIPKVARADRPEKFRPISLCRTIYKVVAKMLVDRLKGTLPGIISGEQGAFVPGRNISHQCLLAQEAVNKLRTSTSKKGLLVLKVDMEQAYDRMSWTTLRLVLSKMGFPDQFSGWILECVMRPRFTLIINGRRTRWIESHCGFRQGCPLSPYLFILCSELLSLALSQRGGDIGFAVEVGGPRISHLLYADDIILFMENEEAEISECCAILDSYCSWTGQRVNKAKSMVMVSKFMDPWRKSRVARRIGVRRTEEIMYLGIKLALRQLKRDDFDALIADGLNKLRSWGNRHLSLAGRATLLRSAFFPANIFVLTHSVVPRGVLDLLDAAGRRFLWQQNAAGRGVHYVPWDIVCSPFSRGGLGIRALRASEGPIRARLAWDFLRPDASLFKAIFHHKYGCRNLEEEVRRADSPAWGIIRSGWRSLEPVLRWTIGDGMRVEFTTDRWIGDKKISGWPTMLNCAAVEDRVVADFITEDGAWDVSLLTSAVGPDLLQCITEVPIRGGPDMLELTFQFSGRSIAAVVGDGGDTGDSRDCRWISKLPLHNRERHFLWRLFWNAVPTRQWLSRRGLADGADCPWGCGMVEDRDHVIGRCARIVAVGAALARWGIRLPTDWSWDEFVSAAAQARSRSVESIRTLLYVAYQCWRARNAKVHGEDFGTPLVIAATVVECLSLRDIGRQTGCWGTNRLRQPSTAITWCPPPPGWLKINIDGSLLPSGMAGTGLVVRREDGSVMVAAGRVRRHWDCGQVEMAAVLAIQEVITPEMVQCKGVWIEGDASNVVSACRNAVAPVRSAGNIDRGVDLSFLAHFGAVRFSFVHRQANRAADYCARKARAGNFEWRDSADFDPAFMVLASAEAQAAGIG